MRSSIASCANAVAAVNLMPRAAAGRAACATTGHASFVPAITAHARLCQPSPARASLWAAVAIVGLIDAALTSSRLAEGSNCTNRADREPFTLQPTTIVVACVVSGC